MTDLNAIDVGRLLQIETKVKQWIDIGRDLDSIWNDPDLIMAEKEIAAEGLWDEREKILTELKSLTGRA